MYDRLRILLSRCFSDDTKVMVDAVTLRELIKKADAYDSGKAKEPGMRCCGEPLSYHHGGQCP